MTVMESTPQTGDAGRRRPSFKLPSGWSLAFRRPSLRQDGTPSPGDRRTPGGTPAEGYVPTPTALGSPRADSPGATKDYFGPRAQSSTPAAERGDAEVPSASEPPPSSTYFPAAPEAPGKRRIGSSATMDPAGAVTVDPDRVFAKLYDLACGGKVQKKGAQGRLFAVRLLPTHCLPDVDPTKLLAAKLISRHPNHHPSFAAYSMRCRREWLCASSLRHPNVIASHEMILDDRCGRYLIIMDLAAGGNLHDWLARDGEKCLRQRLRMWKEAVEGIAHDWLARDGEKCLRQRLRMWKEAVEGIAHMHEMGFAHRDIKPHNFVLHEGRVKVIDFGTAGCSGRGHPGHAAAECDACPPWRPANADVRVATCRGRVGTNPCMAPELFLDEEHDPVATDVFSLGILLLILIGLPHPWASATSSERAWKLWAEKGTWPAGVAERLDAAAVDKEVVRRMLASANAERGDLRLVRGSAWYQSL
ncbi:kinase-like domain-containing protein [Hyaloraphidium curvatum]|nr:kinase-like domain-containing protein [Hyaloraphidium curvatum]